MIRATAKTLAVALLAGFAPLAGAQQTLHTRVLDNYGVLSFPNEGIGCFDVLAAIRLQSDMAGHSVSDQTKQAFSTGSCVVVAPELEVIDAQKIAIDEARLFRGEVSTTEITIYFPEELADLTSEKAAARSAEIASLREIATNLINRVGKMEQCTAERDALNARIDDFNARADVYKARQEEEEEQTGTRLKQGGTTALQIIELRETRDDSLHQESLELQAEADDHNQRCGAYERSITLDKDYLDFYRAAVAARAS